MGLSMKVIEIKTTKDTELVNITGEVKGAVKNIDSGICVVFTRHTTTGLMINEDEAGLRDDVLDFLNEVIPKGREYKHDRIDNNAHSHLKSLLLGPSVTIPIDNGSLALGTWQSIFFVECDGPRKREVYVTVIEG